MVAAEKKMRVVQLGPVPPPHGGVSTNMMAIHDTLVRLGHQSTLIDLTNRSETRASDNVIKPRSAFELIRRLFTLDFDIVHYHIGGDYSVRLALLTLFCGLLPGKKSVVTFHSGGYASDMAGRAKPGSLRGLAFRSIDFLIGVNTQIIEMFKAYGVAERSTRLILPFELAHPDPSVKIPAELARFAEGSNPFLLSIGALEPEYLNKFLIGSMPVVLEHFPGARLMIVGSGSMEQELRRLVVSTGLKDRVLITGNLEHSIVLHLIDRADVLLRITEYDGDAISVREALFLGTPVIASDNSMRPNRVLLLRRPLSVDQLVERLIETEEAQPACLSGEVENMSNSEKVALAYKELLEG